jgi:transposase
MTQQDPGRDRLGRRAKRFLSPSEKYELWLQLVTGELSQSDAAERFGVDRSTVMRIRQVAKQGALEALAASKPGVRQAREDAELAAEVDRLISVGNDLGGIGIWCFLVACAATALALVLRVGRRALPGALVLLVAGLLFTGGWHIYWPTGVATMLVLAVGLGLLAAVLPDPWPRGSHAGGG